MMGATFTSPCHIFGVGWRSPKLHVSDAPSFHFLPGSHRAKSLPNVPIPRLWTSAAVDEGKRNLLVTGGLFSAGSSDLDEAQTMGLVDRFDLATSTWHVLPALNIARHHHHTVCLPQQQIFVMGGQAHDWTALSSVEMYDDVKKTWISGPFMLDARYNAAVTIYQGRILIFGGNYTRGGAIHTSAEQYEPLNQSHDVATREKIYSESCLPTVLVVLIVSFLPAPGWTAIAAPLTARRNHCAVVVNDRILLLGGFLQDQNLTNVVEEYDPATNTWTIVPWTLPGPLAPVASCFCPSTNQLLLIGQLHPFGILKDFTVTTRDMRSGSFTCSNVLLPITLGFLSICAMTS